MLKAISAILLLICEIEFPGKVAGDNLQERRFPKGVEYALTEHLLNGYNKDVRPTKRHTDVVIVTLGLALTQIIGLDEKNQILTTNCWLNQMWIDDKLSWNPLEFGNITSILLPMNRVWKPDILLYNTADADYYHRIISTNGIIHHTGHVQWRVSLILRTSCALDVRNYPFDQQSCPMKFASWTYDGYKVDLVITTDEGDLSNYMPSGEWLLINMTAKRNLVFYSCCPDEPYPDITLNVVIRRRPLFYVCMYLTPCGAATCFVLLGFGIPGKSSEKVFLCIKSLLSLVLFLFMVGDSMPATSATIPLITLCYGVSMLVISLATAVQVWTLNLHYRGARGQKLPKILRSIVIDRIAPFMRATGSERRRKFSYSEGMNGDICQDNRDDLYPHQPNPLIVNNGRTGKIYETCPENYTTQIFGLHLKDFATRLSTTLSLICNMLNKSEDVLFVGIDIDPLVEDWQTVAVVMDRLGAIFFSLLVITITAVIFGRISYD